MLSLSQYKLAHNFSRWNWWEIKKKSHFLACIIQARIVKICQNWKSRGWKLNSFIIIIDTNRNFSSIFFTLQITKRLTNDAINVNVQSMFYRNFHQTRLKNGVRKKSRTSINLLNFFRWLWAHFNYKRLLLSHVDFFCDFMHVFYWKFIM